jgi:hypothetical protein
VLFKCIIARIPAKDPSNAKFVAGLSLPKAISRHIWEFIESNHRFVFYINALYVISNSPMLW